MKSGITALALAAGIAAVSGCTTVYDPYQQRRISVHDPRVIRPVVAIAEFDNRSSFSGKWQLGEGMADVLVTELVETRRVIVLEREQLGGLVSEIARQSRDLFRSEGRVQQGRLKNARYLISGAITDFTVTGDASGWFGTRKGNARTGGSRARVGLHLRITDIQTGEIIGSVKTGGHASAGFFSAAVDYPLFSFGGDAYFRTPLGRATEKAVDKAVGELLEVLPVETWQPRVADAAPDAIIVNGGRNVGLTEGDRFVVRGRGRAVTDPVTGDVLEMLPGPVQGKIEIYRVMAGSAMARLLEGRAERGNMLEKF